MPVVVYVLRRSGFGVVVMLVVGLGLVGASGVGCARPAAGLDSPMAGGRMVGIREVTAAGDRTKVGELITLLASDDAAVRFAANGALKRLTGEDFGFDPSGDWFDREAAIVRWASWYDRAGVVVETGAAR